MPTLKERAEALEAKSRELLEIEASLPPSSLYTRWVNTLGALERRLLALTIEVIKALDGKSEAHLFDLLAVLNSLLDLADRLHERTRRLEKQARMALDQPDQALKGKFQIPTEMLLGEDPATNTLQLAIPTKRSKRLGDLEIVLDNFPFPKPSPNGKHK